MIRQKYKVDIYQFVTTGSVESNCSDITFYNSGENPVLINNAVTLTNGQSLYINANNDELDITNYFFTFQDSVKPSQLIVLMKTYI